MKPKPTDTQTYSRVLGYLKGRIWLFVIAILGYVTAAYAEVVFAQSLGAIVDVFNPDSQSTLAVGGGRTLPSIPLWATQQGWQLLYMFPILICVAALVRGLGSVIGEFLIGHVSLHLIHRVRYDLFSVLLDLPASYFDRNSVGSISNRLTDTVNKLRDTATEVLRILLQDGFKLIVLVVTLVDLNGMLTLIFAATFPIVGVIVHFASKRFRVISQNIQRTMGEVTQVGQEAVSAHKVIKSFGGQSLERDRFHQVSNSNRQQNSKLIATKASSSQFIQFIVALALGGLMGVLFIPEVSATMSTGDLVTYIAVAGVLVQPVRRLADLNARLQTGLAAASEIFEHMDQASEGNGNVAVDKIRGDIEFQDVTFSYESADEVALQNFSFSIKRGETLAIVGESGSGKSTLVELLMGFYHPSAGQILIDGVATTEYDRASLRRQVALVSQDIFLFSDTVRNNIAYGELGEKPEQDVEEAIKLAKVQAFVDRLPQGLDTLVSNRGESLSGGQRQRIAFARALLKDAAILVLDEATSALDPSSESSVLNAVQEISGSRTTIIVAHRLSTIQNADYVLVVDKGHIVEEGTLTDLQKKKSRFSTLFKQSTDQESPKPPKELEHSDFSNEILDKGVQSRLVNAWYTGQPWLHSLRPLSGMFGGAVSIRRNFQKKSAWVPPLPLVVVGNITSGGTGKTPLVIWLTNWLRSRGLKVGIVSRGYGGAGPFPAVVTQSSNPAAVGDETPMIAAHTQCPVVVDPDRVDAVKHLLSEASVDVIISDDGLQHYRLGRHVEIVVVDGERGFGNGLMLPAGPLREKPARLKEVDWVVCNGANKREIANVDDTMDVVPKLFVNLIDGEEVQADEFKMRISGSVHAYSAIGNASRFINTLRGLGLQVQHHELADHSFFKRSHIRHTPEDTVIVTEKDRSKITRIDFGTENLWCLQTDVVFTQSVDERLTTLFQSKGLRLSSVS